MDPDQTRNQRWRGVMARWTAPLQGYLRATHADAATVDEMLWDIWALAVDSEQSVLGCADPWPTLQALAREVARDYVHRARRERPCFDGVLREAPTRQELLTAPEGESVKRAILKWENAALATLSDRQRVIVDLRYRYGLPDDVVAQALGIRETTLRVHSMRGLERLREYSKRIPPPRDWVTKVATSNRCVPSCAILTQQSVL